MHRRHWKKPIILMNKKSNYRLLVDNNLCNALHIIFFLFRDVNFKTRTENKDDGNKKNRLKVPIENLNESQEFAPRTPPSSTIFPVSLRRRPFLPSRGGSIPRGLLPVGGGKSSLQKVHHGNFGPTEQQQQPPQPPSQENVKPVNRDSVLEFRTKVSASIGVEQPQLTSLAAEQASAFSGRTRSPVVSSSRGTGTSFSPLHNQRQSGESNLDRDAVYDSSTFPYSIHQNAPRHRNDPYSSSAAVSGNIKMHFHSEKPKHQQQNTEVGTNSHSANAPFLLSSQRIANSQDEPSLRLGPQTFYSENPKFKTTLVVPPALPGRFVSPPSRATAPGNVRCNSSPHICVRTDQKSAETNSRKTNNPFTYEDVSGKFPKTEDDDDNSNGDDETYDESINDALQQFSTLHPQNVHRGVNSQPEGFKRRYHQDASPHLLRQPQTFETRLAASSSALYRSYAMPVPSLGFPGHHKPASLFFNRQ